MTSHRTTAARWYWLRCCRKNGALRTAGHTRGEVTIVSRQGRQDRQGRGHDRENGTVTSQGPLRLLGTVPASRPHGTVPHSAPQLSRVIVSQAPADLNPSTLGPQNPSREPLRDTDVRADGLVLAFGHWCLIRHRNLALGHFPQTLLTLAPLSLSSLRRGLG